MTSPYDVGTKERYLLTYAALNMDEEDLPESADSFVAPAERDDEETEVGCAT